MGSATAAARADLDGVFDFGAERRGVEEAIDCLHSFGRAYDRLRDLPESGRPGEDIDPALRSVRHCRHLIYYRYEQAHVVIVRILHGAADVADHF